MNECGECTFCCTYCFVPELKKPSGIKCEQCGIDSCLNYKNRPFSCAEFKCAFLQGGKNVALRPDNCGVMFERIGNTMYGTADNREEYPYVEGQINFFKRNGLKVIMRGGKWQ